MSQFTRGPSDDGFTQIPHGLWTLDVSTGARCLLGWLHSHTDQYLASVTTNMARRVFSTSSISRWLNELADAGFITVTKGGHGKGDGYHLEMEPWHALFVRRRHRAETGPVARASEPKPAHHRAETGAPKPAHIEEQVEKTTEKTTTPLAAKPREREPNPLFDVLVEVSGMVYAEMTQRQQKACGVARAQLAAVGATPDDVRWRAEVYKTKYPNAAITPNAMASQWAALAVMPVPAEKKDAMARVRESRAAARVAAGGQT